MTDLSTLIAKLEGLEGPSREVDAEIAATLRVPQNKAPAWIVRWAGAYAVHKGTKVALKHQDGSTGVWWSPQPFTASLDAAMALVEKKAPGTNWNLDKWGASYQAILGEELASEVRGHAETPAIALLIALLRSLSQEGGGG
jgi:hypothetical protein